jgi:hypothetical protein
MLIPISANSINEEIGRTRIQKGSPDVPIQIRFDHILLFEDSCIRGSQIGVYFSDIAIKVQYGSFMDWPFRIQFPGAVHSGIMREE